jgi:hypothetical protein
MVIVQPSVAEAVSFVQLLDSTPLSPGESWAVLTLDSASRDIPPLVISVLVTQDQQSNILLLEWGKRLLGLECNSPTQNGTSSRRHEREAGRERHLSENQI